MSAVNEEVEEADQMCCFTRQRLPEAAGYLACGYKARVGLGTLPKLGLGKS